MYFPPLSLLLPDPLLEPLSELLPEPLPVLLLPLSLLLSDPDPEGRSHFLVGGRGFTGRAGRA